MTIHLPDDLHERLTDIAAAAEITLEQAILDELRAMQIAQDAGDVAACEAALAEPGASIPWEQVKAELGLRIPDEDPP